MSDKPTNDPAIGQSKPRYTATFISIIASIIAIIAVAFSIFIWNQSNHNESQLNISQKTDQATVSAKISDLNGNLQRQQQNLDATQDNVSHLMKSIGNPERPQALSQISYLINIANLQLRLNQNTEAAIHYLTLAKNRVNALSDPSLIDLKRSLINDLNQLQAVPQFDKSSLIFKLDDINAKIQTLSTIPDLKKSTAVTDDPIAKSDNKKPWYARFWQSIKGLKDLVTIRHSNKMLAPLLSKDQEQLLKERIAAKINQIEWAVLHQNNDLYQHNIKQVKGWLTQYFHSAKDIDDITAAFDNLAKINVAPKVPNITASLSIIRNVLNRDNNIAPFKKPTKPNATHKTKPKEKTGAAT